MTELIDKLKEIKQGESYENMARDMGVSLQTVYRWVNGRSAPSGLALEKIAKYVRKH